MTLADVTSDSSAQQSTLTPHLSDSPEPQTSPPGVDVRLQDDQPAEMVSIVVQRPAGPVAAIRVSPQVTLLAEDPMALDALIAAGIRAQDRLTAARANRATG